MFLSRRTFLFGSGALLLSRLGRATPAGRELVVGGLKTQEIESNRLAFYLVAVDASGQKFCNVALPFHMHGFAPHPKTPERVVLFEKQGPGACEVDLKKGAVLRTIEPAPDCTFYGHGTYGHNASVLYATESKKDGTGLVSIRDGKTFALLGQFPTYGVKPHDCQLIDDERTLVITNGGGKEGDSLLPPSVTYVDCKSQKLLEKLTLSSPRINAGHLFVGRKRELVVVSAPRDGLPPLTSMGALSIRQKDSLRTLSQPEAITKKMLGETLSLSLHQPSGVVGVTNPDGNLLTFWSLKKMALVKAMELEHPRGITLSRDQRYFVVSCGRQPALIYLSTASLAQEEARTVPDVGFSSSHIYTHLV